MDLDLLQPRTQRPARDVWTSIGSSGVSPFVRIEPLPLPAPPSTLRARHLVLVLLVAMTLLGQGPRDRVDARFRSPSATIHSLWSALASEDDDAAAECYLEGRHDLPLPGTLWFLPSTDELWVDQLRSLPVTGGRVMASYEVHYRAHGESRERMFKTACELVRDHGEWRIAGPVGEASWPAWHAVPTPVDI